MARPRKSNQIPEWSGMPTSEGQLKEIKIAIEQTHPSFTQIDSEKASITDIFEEVHAKYGMPRRVFNALAKFSYYGNASDQFHKNSEIEDAWNAIENV